MLSTSCLFWFHGLRRWWHRGSTNNWSTSECNTYAIIKILGNIEKEISPVIQEFADEILRNNLKKKLK
jgi:hypothetical protein